MTKSFEVLDSLSEHEFVSRFIRENKPVIVRDQNFEAEKWTPEIFKDLIGDMPTQVYGSLFNLKEVSTVANYIDTHFNVEGVHKFRENVPYIRWYNKLKEIEYAWSDEAFARLSDNWKKPTFLPDTDLLVPATGNGRKADPVFDNFPYRGILVAAKGARTRTHTDPFCSDAVVNQLYGVKEVAMYSPARAEELMNKPDDSTSYGGFVDVRESDLSKLSVEPDYHGFLKPGEVVYVPHGWIHDVIVTEDSLSITWNFVHAKGALEFVDYLMDGPDGDSEFEVLKFFYSLVGEQYKNSNEIVKAYNTEFAEIVNELS